MQGRVACEVSAADELLLTEMIFGNVFEELDVPQVRRDYGRVDYDLSRIDKVGSLSFVVFYELDLATVGRPVGRCGSLLTCSKSRIVVGYDVIVLVSGTTEHDLCEE